MTDDEFLEKVCNVAEKWSKPYLVTVGGYLLSTLIIALNVTDWVVASARDNLGALIAFGVGGVLTGAVLASLFWRHVVKRALRAKDDATTKTISSGLDGIDGLGHIDNLDSLVEKARELSSLNDQLAAEIAARDAEIAEVRHSRDRQLEKYRNVFDLDRFDVRSCRVMFEVYEAESGPRGALYLSSDNLVAASLISEGVLDMYGSTLRGGMHAFRLTPEWRRFIRGNLNELRERLAEDQRDAGEDQGSRACVDIAAV